VVGWCRGRMEFGPRALGHRSILADPRRPDMQRRVNEKIKFREGFRPFAPAVLRERVTEWFDLDTDSPYMLLVAEVARSKRVERDPGLPEPEGLDRLHVPRSVIPAVTHVDGSARVQTVSADVDPDFHRLLRSFEARTGCPVLLNTSFNLRGEPIVRTAADACRTFRACHLDALVVDSWLVERPDGLPIVPLPPTRSGTGAAPPKRLRRFGLELSAGLLAAAGLTLWAWESPRAALGLAIVATLLAVSAWVRPSGLAAVERPWMRTVRVVAGGLSFLLTAVVHLALVTPLGLIRRVFRPDPLDLRPDRARSSWWSARVARVPDPESYRHPF